MPAKIPAGIRWFALARSGGILYAMLQDTKDTIRLFMSPAVGTKGWVNSFDTVRTWFEWCPGTPTADAGAATPTWNWKKADTGACSTAAIAPGVDVAFPSMAIDGRGRILISYLRNDGGDAGTSGSIWTRASTNPQLPNSPLQGPTNITPTFTLPTSTIGFARPLGDYNWIATKPAQGPTGGEIFTKNGCTNTNDFFPMWVQSDPASGAIPVVAAKGVSVTP